MLPYSLDLRERVVRAYERGVETIEEVATRFSVGQTFVKKMLRQKRETGLLEILDRRPPGPAKRLTEKDLRWLRRQIAKEPDLTIDQLHERMLTEKKVMVSRATVGRAVQSLNLPLKKRVNRPSSKTSGNVLGTGGA